MRPTSDRVREAIFDILFSLGGVDGLMVADLFAGSGAMGIEALSRGAASVTFVDRSPEALAAVRANLASVGLADAERDGDATVVRADAASWAVEHRLALRPRPVRPALRLRRVGIAGGDASGRSGHPRIGHARSPLRRGGESSKPGGMGVRS